MFTWRYTVNGRDVAAVTDPIWKSPQGGPLSIVGPNDVSLIEPGPADLTRYRRLLPVDEEHLVTLGAGMTPLVRGRLAGREVYFKLDSLLPTGSFKDRGAAVSVALLRSIGVDRIVVDSSGNAAAAMSAYCAASDIDCTVYAPETASPGKLVQSRAYGAVVRLAPGTRDDVASAAQTAGESDPAASYISHNWSPIFAEGVKTWALEVWEQLGSRSPDRAFIPTGGGSALVGGRRGFDATDAMPRLIACQPDACAPLVAAVKRGADDVSPVEPGSTMAEGARIANPPRGRLLLDALSHSSGQALAIREDELHDALIELWRQGFYAEPTAALGAAGFIQAARSGQDLTGINVVLITGSGMKATDTIDTLVSPSSI